MDINSISNVRSQNYFGRITRKQPKPKSTTDSIELNNNPVKKKTLKEKLANIKDKIKLGIAAIIGALVSAATVLFITKNKIDKAEQKNQELKEALECIVVPDDMDKKVSQKVSELSSRSLDYNPLKQVIELPDESKQEIDDTNAIVMKKEPEKTNNRADAKELNYPVYQFGQPYHFQFPESKEMKITKDHQSFTPIPLQTTTLSENYADSLNWNNDKISRDLLQNFFDGHGQTLDGVEFDITPSENGKQKVRISGKSVYSPDKAILLGESSKKDDKKAAGYYGEGLKMVVLKLLKEKGADKVKIAAGDWTVNWQFAKSGLNNNRVLAYELAKSETPIDGNYIEFETNDKDFITSITKSYDRFYHYNNPAFKCPDFENDKLGIKILDNDKTPGKLFITGQEFEIDGNFDGLLGANIFIKEKPPITDNDDYVFDPSRDRTSLTSDNIKAIGEWLSSNKSISNEDVVKIIHSLKDYWEVYPLFSFDHLGSVNSFLSGFLDGCYNKDDLKIKFPDNKYVADSFKVSNELKAEYYQAGYKICYSYFEKLGMPSIKNLVNKSRQHHPLEPTEQEKNKILILKDALKILSPFLKSGDTPLFSEQELNPTILIFDRTSPKENKIYENTDAEAIIEQKIPDFLRREQNQSLGFWIDRGHLKSSFSNVLGTALHELTHKYGGDGSEIFSYRLTDVLQKVLQSTNDNPNIALQLKVLEQAWEQQK